VLLLFHIVSSVRNLVNEKNVISLQNNLYYRVMHPVARNIKL
jgi:hypothetical protein